MVFELKAEGSEVKQASGYLGGHSWWRNSTCKYPKTGICLVLQKWQGGQCGWKEVR